MTQKLFSISLLLVSLTLLTMFGCGSDEEKPTVTPAKPKPVVPPPEELLGSWDVVSINDEHPLIFVNADEPDEEERPKLNTENFYYVFAEDNSWTLNVKFEMTDFLEDPHKDDPEMAGKVELTGVWSGTYSVNDSVLSLVNVETDVDITSVPEDFLANVFEVTEIAVKNEILGKFKTHVFNPFAKTFISIDGDTLNLEATVLQKTKWFLKSSKFQFNTSYFTNKTNNEPNACCSF